MPPIRRVRPPCAAFQTMRAKGFSDMDALHAIAFVMQEQTWHAKTAGVDFDMKQYVERAKAYVQNATQHPDIVRTLRLV